jgi:hypothetical protein
VYLAAGVGARQMAGCSSADTAGAHGVSIPDAEGSNDGAEGASANTEGGALAAEGGGASLDAGPDDGDGSADDGAQPAGDATLQDGGDSGPQEGGSCPVLSGGGCSGSPPSYANEIASVIGTYCLACHGDAGPNGPDLTTYGEVHATQALSLDQIGVCEMPPASAPQLPESLRQALAAWLECGAPNN